METQDTHGNIQKKTYNFNNSILACKNYDWLCQNLIYIHFLYGNNLMMFCYVNQKFIDV